VIALPSECLGEAAGLLARCFYANSNFIAIFPDERSRSDTLPRMFAAGLRDALGFGPAYSATREAGRSTRDQVAGVALWLPPGVFPLSTARQLRALPDMAGIARLHPASSRWKNVEIRLIRAGYDLFCANALRRVQHPAFSLVQSEQGSNAESHARTYFAKQRSNGC
jgi:hypothetical protein